MSDYKQKLLEMVIEMNQLRGVAASSNVIMNATPVVTLSKENLLSMLDKWRTTTEQLVLREMEKS